MLSLEALRVAKRTLYTRLPALLSDVSTQLDLSTVAVIRWKFSSVLPFESYPFEGLRANGLCGYTISTVCIKSGVARHTTSPIPSSSPPHIPPPTEVTFCPSGVMEQKSCELPLRPSAHHAQITCTCRALPASGSPAPSVDGHPARLSDGKATAKEIYPDIDESALIRKIDIRVVPALFLLFFFAFLDRVNIANAAVYGMNKELGLVANQYNAVLTIL